MVGGASPDDLRLNIREMYAIIFYCLGQVYVMTTEHAGHATHNTFQVISISNVYSEARPLLTGGVEHLCTDSLQLVGTFGDWVLDMTVGM